MSERESTNVVRLDDYRPDNTPPEPDWGELEEILMKARAFLIDCDGDCTFQAVIAIDILDAALDGTLPEQERLRHIRYQMGWLEYSMSEEDDLE